MDICLMIEGQEGVTWDQWLAVASACQEHGFAGLFRSDHYLSFGRPSERGSLDAWATIAALGARTERIQLGTMVSPVTFRHPSELAKVVVLADHASGGRVAVGMGAGWFEGEHRAYGFPFPTLGQRMEMLEEQVEMVHRSLSHDEESVTFQGRHYRLEACPAIPKPVQRPHPPLIIGGQAGPRSVRLAARWADEYNINFVGPDDCRQARTALDQACIGRGRDPAEVRLSLMTGALIGEDRRALERRATALMQRRGQNGDPAAYLQALDPAWITGPPDQALERLSALAGVGVRRVLLQHLLHEDLEAIALIGSEIIPAAAAL